MRKSKKYLFLINEFVSNNINAKQFEGAYLSYFQWDTGFFDTEYEYEILNELFFAVDDFCDNPEIFQDDNITAEELHAKAKEVLEKLLALEK